MNYLLLQNKFSRNDSTWGCHVSGHAYMLLVHFTTKYLGKNRENSLKDRIAK